MKPTTKHSFFFIILFILCAILLLVYYRYKKIYTFLFDTLWGYFLMFIIIGGTYYLDKNLGIYTGFIVALLLLLTKILTPTTNTDPNTNANPTKTKEGFNTANWPENTLNDFLLYEKVKNPNVIFDVSLLQQQASAEEAQAVIDTGMWPWSQEVQDMFMEAVSTSTMLKTLPANALIQARTVYNESIMKEMLSWQAKEGQFLLNGINRDEESTDTDTGKGTYGINSGLVSKNESIIRCGKTKGGKIGMQQIRSLNNDGITGVHNNEITEIDYQNLPTLVKGFSFVREPCDPCTALDNPPNYTCPFKISDEEPSTIWSYLWGLTESEITGAGTNIDQTKFPLLKELQNELNNLMPETGVTTFEIYTEQ